MWCTGLFVIIVAIDNCISGLSVSFWIKVNLNPIDGVFTWKKIALIVSIIPMATVSEVTPFDEGAIIFVIVVNPTITYISWLSNKLPFDLLTVWLIKVDIDTINSVRPFENGSISISIVPIIIKIKVLLFKEGTIIFVIEFNSA